MTGADFFFAQAAVTPSIPVVWAVFQTLGVVVLAFGVLVLVMSHLRYQSELKRLEVEKDPGMGTDDLRLWLLERIRGAAQCVVLFRCPEETREAVLSVLRSKVRADDEVLLWKGEGVLTVFAGEDGLNGLRAGARLGGLLSSEDSRGIVTSVVSPSPPPLKGLLGVVDDLLERLRAGEMPESGWVLPTVKEEGGAAVSEGDRPLLDPVTGVLRMERVPTAVQKALASFRRRELPVSLVLFELDDPDTYYVEGGSVSVRDAVLKAAAACLMRNCRETDLVGRFSETGFVLVVPGEAVSAGRVVGRILAAMKQDGVEREGQRYRFTLSAGVAGAPEHGSGPRRLFAACQEALEVAKGRGRGLYQVYEPGLRPPVEGSAARGAAAPEAF